MKAVLIAASALSVIGTTCAAIAQVSKQQEIHTVLTPQEIKWEAAPAALPKGAERAVLYGDPSKDAPFVMRLKLPQNFHIPPHTHPVPEVITVISGDFRLGMGSTAKKGETQALPAGSFWALSPGMAHYTFAEEETVIQISTTGPWGINYLDPKDDPRQKVQ